MFPYRTQDPVWQCCLKCLTSTSTSPLICSEKCVKLIRNLIPIKSDLKLWNINTHLVFFMFIITILIQYFDLIGIRIQKLRLLNIIVMGLCLVNLFCCRKCHFWIISCGTLHRNINDRVKFALYTAKFFIIISARNSANK